MSLGDVFGPWGWAIAAVLLALGELLLPGVFLVWLGAAAAVTALLVGVFDLAITVQLVLFGVLAIVSIALARGYFPYGDGAPEPSLNRLADRLIGRQVVVIEAIRHGRGRVQVGDSPWAAQGPDLPEGSRAEIVGVDGTILIVEPLP
jgi:membrane protein implicated in regulation of membrane protease activity